MSRSARHGSPALERWGRHVARRAKAIVIFWLLFIVVGFAVALGATGTPSLFSRLDSGEIVVAGENQDGRDLLAQGGGSGFSTYTQTLTGVDLSDPAVASAAASAVQSLSAIEHVESAVNPFVVPGGPTTPDALRFVLDGDPASGGFATVVTFDEGNTAEQEAAATDEVDAVFDSLAEDTGATGDQRGGLRALVDRIIEQVKIDGQRGEGIALPVSFLVMVVVFGGFLAAGFPVLGAIASIAGALASLLGLSYLLDLDASVVNVVTVLGLGLCIDYGLLVVSRFREEMRALLQGAPVADATHAQVVAATAATMNRAGRTVIFSALTVAISLSGLLVLQIPFIRAVSVAGVSVVLIALAVALTLIPALCVLGARRLLKRGTETAADVGVFSRLAERVHRMPWVVIAAVSAVLVVMALPALRLELTSSGPELLPVGTPERTFYEDFRAGYPLLAGAEVLLVSRAPVSEVQAWAETAAADRPGVESVDPARELGNGVVTLGFQTGDSGTGEASRALVDSLRSDRAPFDAYVVGQASGIVDFRATVADRALWAAGLVVLATLVLLFLMTGSVVIPIKALVMNVLSLGAALGVTVWIFEDGHLEGLLRFASTGALENTIPLLVLAFGFGLSMDYEVFLLSRIVELHEQGHDTRSAVTLGLQRSGRIITSAALLMVIVFSGFAAGDLLIMKQMGVALVLAIVIDATLVRMLLVPATMSVLGSANWWAPAPLRRLHERWGITE
ncbi:MMPL family transporter [Ornithinibacter aureus]|uniref:MMPL family transporter n=1 Tax=Ornithinibacter aureus TaxID=622664 RepID=A0ABP8JD47_9MICO|nr:MMPL family transporter [Ornithinibacter aureus]KAF0832570.1 RND superfamily putative drug exporter [Ornithinibacter aureus]